MHVPMRAGSENRTSVGGVVGGVLGAVVVLVLVILLVLLIIILLKRKTGIDPNGNSFLTLYCYFFGFIMFQLNHLTEEPSSVDIELKKNVVYGVSQQGQPFVTI